MSLEKQRKPYLSNNNNRSNDMFIRPSAPQIAQDKKGANTDFDPDVKLNHFGEPAFIQPNGTVQARFKNGQVNQKYENSAGSAAENTNSKSNDFSGPTQASEFESISQVQTKKENNSGLPTNLKAGVENLSGYSMDDVKVHRNSSKPSQLQAHAYAQGTDIHLGPGQEKHLAHEAWHVVQQKQGRVEGSSLQMKTTINNDVGLENEADVMGAKAMQFSNEQGGQLKPEASKDKVQGNKATGNVTQLYKQYSTGGEADSKKEIHWKANGDPLRVAEDGTAAIAQEGYYGGQEMYVDSLRLPKINADLKKANSPVEFIEMGGKTVEGATPGDLEAAKKKLVQVKPVEPADHSEVKEIPNDCGQAARCVTGATAESKTLKTKYTDAAGNVANTVNSNPELMKYEVMVEHFGAQITDSAKIVGDIATQIEAKSDLYDQIEPFWDRLQPISESMDTLNADFQNELKSATNKIKAYNAEIAAIADPDPKEKAKKIALIESSIKAVSDAFEIYRASYIASNDALVKEWTDILAEKIGAKTVAEVFDEYADSVAEYDKLKAQILKPYNDQSTLEKKLFDEKVGINRYSNPDVGEAHTMSSGGTDYPGKSTWNFHWAGVIFKSITGSDNITMENYAGSADSDWALQMYGVPTKGDERLGQTFQDIHKGTKQHGDNPTTLTTEKK